mgnify:CR=1 FL=1
MRNKYFEEINLKRQRTIDDVYWHIFSINSNIDKVDLLFLSQKNEQNFSLKFRQTQFQFFYFHFISI